MTRKNAGYCFRKIMIMVILLGELSWIISCASNRTLRFYLDVRATYRNWNEDSLNLLIEASLQPDRDIVAASVYYLGLYVNDLVTGKKKTETALEPHLNRIKSHLEKVYLLNQDFNIKNLCVKAISYHRDEGTYTFLRESLKTYEDSTTGVMILKALRDYIREDKEHMPDTMIPTLKTLTLEDNVLFEAGLYNLSLYPYHERIVKGLRSYVELNTKTYRSYLVRAALRDMGR